MQFLPSRLQKWLPHLPLALLVGLQALLLGYPLLSDLPRTLPGNFWYAQAAILAEFSWVMLPRLLLSSGLVLMAIGLLLKARIAWFFSVLLLLLVTPLLWRAGLTQRDALAFSWLLILLLLFFRKAFDRSSVVAGTLLTILIVSTMLSYAMLGSLSLGNEFVPPILNPMTALYFSMVTMTTVGYGDIVPHSDAARLFTLSIIVLGITVFATALSTLFGPLLSASLQRIVKGRKRKMNRSGHYLIVGASPLAHNLYAGLSKRGLKVSVLVPAEASHCYPDDADVIVGETSDSAVLLGADADKANAVLALRGDDAENAFIILAMKEVAPEVRTVVLVNDSRHLEKIKRCQPDVLIAPQLLGSEILARLLNGETVDKDTITDLLLQGDPGKLSS
ncbi:voltage-gated potassium channel protein [Craterilacuibacter sp.]|uniref:voltage-gated potassium channel protein n=1 Tax=Craterilacuibacter sp. TaxID=2870909 RepID=UPI003F33F599